MPVQRRRGTCLAVQVCSCKIACLMIVVASQDPGAPEKATGMLLSKVNESISLAIASAGLQALNSSSLFYSRHLTNSGANAR